MNKGSMMQKHLIYLYLKIGDEMSSAKTVTKNSIFLLISSIFQKVVSFLYFTYLARHLPADSVGKYAFSISFSFMFAVFMDFGTNSLLIRKIARSEDDQNKNVNHVFALEVILGIIFILLSSLIINIIGYPDITKQLIYISIITVFFDNLTTTFYATLRGKQELWFESIGYAAYQVIVFVLGIYLVKNNYPLIYLAMPPLIATLSNFVYSFIIAKVRSGFKFNLNAKYQDLIKIVKESLPFALTGIFTKIYTSVDSFFLSLFSTDEHIAYYQASYKLVFAMQFIPIAIGSAIFPAFAKDFKEDKEQLNNTFLKSFKVLSFIAIPLTFGFMILAKDLILLLYPTYTQSIEVLQIFALIFFFMFLNTPVGLILSSCDRQRINTRNTFIAMVVNVILNLILIPLIDIKGAAIASLITFIILFFTNFFEAKKTINFSTSDILKMVSKILLASIIMSIFILLIKTKINFIIAAILGSGLYFLLMQAFGVFDIKDSIKNLKLKL